MRGRHLATSCIVGGIGLVLAAGGPALALGGGGELVVAAIQEVQSMQAQTAYKEVNAIGIRNVIEQLTTLDPDTGELKPMLALSWEQVEPTRWRFELRQGISFHDGTPFNAEAAAVSLNWLWSPANNYSIREMRGPEIDAKAAGEYTLDIATEAPDPLLPIRMYLAGITSAEQILNDPTAHDHTPLGTGPYRFVEWVRGQHWSMEKNPDWWGIDAPDTYGEIFFDTVKIVFRPEATVRAAMVENGEAHLGMFLTVEDCNRFEAADGLKCIVAPSDTYLQIRLDYSNAHPTLTDLRFREAFALAIDTDGIREHIMVHGAPLRGQMLPEQATGYHDGLEPYGYDPERAAALIEELQAEGVEIPTVHIATRLGSTPRNGEMIEAIGAMLSEIGIPNTVAVEEPAVFNVWVTTKPTPPRASAWMHPQANPLMDYAATFRANYSCGGIVSVWCDEEFDRRLGEAEALIGQERHEALKALNQYAYDHFVIDGIGLLSRAYGMPDNLEWSFGLDQRIQAVNMRLTD
jgi:peptide/nickel transport system substrate-binding protein